MTEHLEHKAADEDFVLQLQARLGILDEAAVVSTLGDWLSSYQPGPAALTRGTRLRELGRNAA